MRLKKIKISFYFFCILQSNLFAQWSAPMSGLGYGGYGDFLEWNGKLYILNSYSTGTDTICGIAAYDGSNFSAPMFPGFPVISAAIYNNEFYAGGSSGATNCGALPPGTNNIAKWNGSGWSSVGGGGPGGTMLINAMAVYKGELYVGGNFTSMGGVSVNRIARWDGTQWKNVGGGVTGSIPQIYSMTVYNGNLYVGGTFGNAGGIAAYNIARWNGTQWDSVGLGADGIVEALYTDTIDNMLYVGGGFYNAGGIFTGCFAKWNDTIWSAVGNYKFLENVYAVARYNNKIYIGKGSNGSITDTAVAVWDGNYWCPMVPGPNNAVRALAEYQGKLYIGGFFDTVSTIAAYNIVAWGGAPCPTAGINENVEQIKFKIFPNPAKNNISIETAEDKKFVVRITNPLGQKVAEKTFQKRIEVDISSYGKGLFLVEVCDEKGVKCHTEKVVIQ